MGIHFAIAGVALTHVVEGTIAWTLAIVGAVIGAAMVAIGMLEELPDIIRVAWNDLVHK